MTKKLTVTIILMKVIHSFDVYGMFPGIRIMLSMRDNAYDASIVHVFGLWRFSYCSGCLLNQ